jgi:hypothetical protein
MENFPGHALCQAVRLEGIPKRAERNLENQCRRLFIASGPQFLLDYLKVLKQETIDEVQFGDGYHFRNQPGQVSVAWNHAENRPKGGFSVLYKYAKSPAHRLRLIGAVMNAIQFEAANRQQVKKLYEGIRNDTRSDGRYTVRFSPYQLWQMERELTRHVRKQQPFGYSDLTHDCLPSGVESHRIANLRKETQELLHLQPASPQAQDLRTSLISRYEAELRDQFYHAPTCVKRYWNEIVSLSNGSADLKVPGKVELRPEMARDYDAIDSEGRRWCDVAAEFDGHRADFIGRLDFLQKPGGKLRSVANVNRYVNWTMQPFADMLQEFLYNRHRENGVWVTDQFGAMKTVQSWLSEGRTLASVDLTSATDLLDFRVFTNALKQSFRGSTGLLALYAEYFETLSELPMWCEELGVAVQFTTGQPLGMKGSFQVLTWMNALAAGASSLGECHFGDVGFATVVDNSIGRTDVKPWLTKRSKDEPANFAVVGDDTVIEAEARSLYDAIITSWNGQTNAEKCLVSSETAEFLSHLITPTTVLVIKPKYRLGHNSLFVNAEKAKVRNIKASGLYRLSPDDVTALEILSEYSVKELDDRMSLPRFRSRKTGAVSEYDKAIMDSALRITAELGSRPDLSVEVTPVSADLALSLNPQPFTRQAGDGPAIGPRRRPTDAITPTTSVYNYLEGKHQDVAPDDLGLAATYQAAMNQATRIAELSQLWLEGDNDTSDSDPETDLAAKPKRGGPTDETVLLVASELVDLDNGKRPTDEQISQAAIQAVSIDYSPVSTDITEPSIVREDVDRTL